jgi:hypothetical protein
MFMSVVALLYAVFRVWAFHPALRPSYYRWLSGTPWTSQKPLPLGPIHLVLQDVLILGVMAGLCWPRAELEAHRVLQAFLSCYLAMLAITHFSTGQKGWAYAVAFGLGFMGLFALDPLFYVVAGAVYVAAVLGLRASLAQFPWSDTRLSQLFKSHARLRRNRSLGWPFDRLGPKLPTFGLTGFTRGDVFVSGLLAGWFYFLALNQLSQYHGHGELLGPTLLTLYLLLYAVLARMVIYCHGYVPPMSLLGRIAHGRLIIPGYDKVFVAPLLAVSVFISACLVPSWTGISQTIALPIGVTTSWWILFGMGPGLDAWRLTGNHRVIKGLMGLGQAKR